MKKAPDSWNNSNPYEYFMGRWSRLMAPVFLRWLNFPYNRSWLDIGCGTGALSEGIFRNCKPAELTCVDPSPEFLDKAREKLQGNCNFITGNSSDIPCENNTFDIVVSGLALNFFPDLKKALSEMKRILKPESTIAAYVWDYAGRMDFLRIFWDAACKINPDAKKFDEGIRFPVCNIDYLRNAFQNSDLTGIEITYLDIDTIFSNFDDYWNPFLGGQGPAPGYLDSLSSNSREELKNYIQNNLPVQPDGSIKLLARAIAIKGIRNL